MIKKIFIFILFLFIINIYSNSINIQAKDLYDGDILDLKIEENREFRGVWVSALVSDIPRFTSVSQYQKAITDVLNNMEKYNFNTLVFHIRIYNDAFYESEYSNYSYLYKTNANYDMLPWIINECHKRGIEFHAWMNPYRVSTNTSATLDNIAKNYHSKNAASNTSNLLKGYTYVILDPGMPAVQQFLHNVVMEVVTKYDVDAIHFDDYFYAAGVDDSFTYKMYGKDYQNVSDFRRASVSKLIESLHNSITEHNKTNNKAVKLGISPTGIYRCGDGNVTYDEEGHAITNGAAMGSYLDQHYNSACADTLLWIQKGWIDYIVPQLYVDGDYFRTMSTWWDKVMKNEKCLFITGITHISCDWNHFSNLPNRDGICLFSYKMLTKLMESNDAKLYLQNKALPKINYCNEFLDNDFDAVLFKDQDNYKLAINKTNPNVNWYIIKNNLDVNKKYQNLTNENNILIEETDNKEELSYTITPLLKNGKLGVSKIIKYNQNIVQINFYDDENNIIKTDYLNIGDEITYPELKTSDTYSYKWDNLVTVAQTNLNIKMLKSDKEYTITYIDPDGNTITTQKYKYGESLDLPQLPESKKYIYSKWKVNSRYTVKNDDVIELSYKLIDYNLKVFGNGFKLLDKTVYYGDNINDILSEITNYHLLDGQEFVSFDNQSDYIEGDTILNATYKFKDVTVTYIFNDEILKKETYQYGDDVSLDKTLKIEGYILKEFTINNQSRTFISSIKEDIIVNCIFEKENGCNKGYYIFNIYNLLIFIYLFRRKIIKK